MLRSFDENHKDRMTSDPEYAAAYVACLEDELEENTRVLREARVGLAMWSMSTHEIDKLIGPMNDEDRIKARAGRGGPLWDECTQIPALGYSSSKE